MKGDTPTNGLVEHAMMQVRGIIRTINYHVAQHARQSGTIREWCRGSGNVLSRCHEEGDGRDTL